MKGTIFAGDLLKLILNATPIANVADNAGASPLTNLYASLHTGDPSAGDQTTSEAAYTGYARVAVARTSGGWTITGASASPAALIGFGACTAGGGTYTHFAVGSAASGAGKVLWSGVIGSDQGVGTAKASNDTISAPGGSFAVGDQVIFSAYEGFALPAGITAGTAYFVKTVAGTDITISATNGGATLDITADGVVSIFKATPLVVTSSPSVTPQLATGTTIKEF